MRNDVLYVDVHSHAHEYGVEGVRQFTEELGLIIVIVSDDYETSVKTVNIAEKVEKVVPCVGVHPWTVDKLGPRRALEEAKKTIELALERGITCLGEIGLDAKFVPDSIEAQREVFKLYLEAARSYGFRLNLHTAGTWREVFELLVRYDVGYANFHWYTGPLDLLDAIVEHGYTISINPAVKIQKKHREVVRRAPLESMLTESDAPYKYKGLELSPRLVPMVVGEIAAIKGLEPSEVKGVLYNNFRKKWSLGL